MNMKKPDNVLVSNRLPISATFLTLTMLYITLTLAANAIFEKIIHIRSFEGVGGELLLPIIFLLEDIIAEVYGFKVSRTLLWLAMIAEFIFSSLILIIIHLPSPTYWTHQEAFNIVFNKLLRVGPIAIIAVLSGQFVNIYLLAKFKIMLKGGYFWFRSVVSTCVGAAVVGILYYGVGFWNIYPLHAIWNMFISDYILRIAYAIVGGGPATIIIFFLKKIENIDIYDISTNFNPFKISLDD